MKPALKYFRRCRTALLGLIILLYITGGTLFAAQASVAPTAQQSRQCRSIIQALERAHFTGKKMDKAMSAMVFDRYIKNLDPARHLLTHMDMDEFQPLKHLMYRYVQKGDLGPAFEIFNIYQARRLQRLDYILASIKTWETDLDFTLNEELVIDTDIQRFVPAPSDLNLLWKKELKNHIISLKLDGKDNPEITETLEKIYTSRRNRLEQVQGRDVFQIFMNAVTACFDPHTQYFPPRVSEDFDIQMSLSLEGIGAVLQNEYEYTKVVRLIPKGPADKSHLLMPGDKIIGVGQGTQGEIKDTIGQRIDDVVKLIRGPKDTFVRLKIIPAKNANDTATISIKRDKVKLEEQSAKKRVVEVASLGKTYKIGIIEIPNFYIDFQAYHRGDKDYKSTSRDVEKLLGELKEEKIDGLIVDLRDNGGGALKEANDLTGLFLKSGPTVQIKTKHRISRLYDQDPAIVYTGPLVVLINRMSASASEIFAGAIKDYNRGIIVGSRSFGKGTVQELKPLGEGRLKLTSAKFYRISGKSTQHKGVEPDIHFPRIYNVEDIGESAFEGALLWDRITATPYHAYRPIRPMFNALEQEYASREGKDPGMAYLKQRIDMANRLGSIQRLSLNLENRSQMDKDQSRQELTMENQFRAHKGEAPVENLEDTHTTVKEFNEILMGQTEYLAADYIRLSRQLGYTW
ncbi:MAG: carboxy terminal-processing peptidase [Desulfobacter sp.]|nr:MAG: carboxy terminal-processing peptidase [Desulfobacter sp.]